MPAGRPRKPKETKKAQGTLRPCREVGDNPQYELIAKSPPDFLSQGAKMEWAGLVELLQEAGVIKVSDAMALGMLCEDYREYKNMCRRIDREGFVIDGKRSPVLKIRDDANKRVFDKLAHFGLTPASRSRIIVDKKKDKSELALLMDM